MERIKREKNEEYNALIYVNRLSPTVHRGSDYGEILKNIKPREYERETFYMPKPTEEDIRYELYLESLDRVKSPLFWTLARKRTQYINDNFHERYEDAYIEWCEDKEEFEREQDEIESEKNKAYIEEYEIILNSLNDAVDGQTEYVNNAIDMLLKDIEAPMEFSVDYDYNRDENVLWVDLDLPEIEDFPKYKKTQREAREDYKTHVFGLAVYLSSYLYNVSPKIKRIVISAYTQRRDKNGDIKDEYIYSIIFERDEFEQLDIINSEPYDICMQFKNRCNITATHIMRAIKPFERDDIIVKD